MKKSRSNNLAAKRKKNKTLQKTKNNIIYHSLKGGMAFGRTIPLSWGLFLGRHIGHAAFALVGAEREKALTHLKVAFPEKNRAWIHDTARQCFGNLGMSFFELMHADEIYAGLKGKGKLVGYMKVDGLEHLDKQVASGTGGFALTAHTGNWELMASSMGFLGYPVNAIVRKLYDPRIDELLNGYRKKYNIRPISRVGKAMVPEIMRCFQANEIMGLLLDQDTRVRGVFAPFFGHLAHTASGPAFLAIQAGKDAVPLFMHRRADYGHQVTILPAIPRPNTGDIKTDVYEFTKLFNKSIEANIRAHPSEWVWMHRRWKTRPEDEPPEANPAILHPRLKGKWKLRIKGAIALASGLGWASIDNAAGLLAKAAAWNWADRSRVIEHVEKAQPGYPNKNALAKHALANRIARFLRLTQASRMDQPFFKTQWSVTGEKVLQDALAAKKGAIILCGHLGSPEDVAFWLAANGYPVWLASSPVQPGPLNRWLAWVRRKGQVPTISLALKVPQTDHPLKMGGCLGLILEDSQEGDGTVVSFLGGELRLAKQAQRALLQFDCPLLMAYATPADAGKRCVTFAPVDRFENEKDSATRLGKILKAYEAAILANPKKYAWPTR